MQKLQKLKIEDYRNNPGFSYSSLSNLTVSPGYYLFRKKEKSTSLALTTGSAVDTLLTNPEEFDELFVVNTYTKPSAQLGEYCDIILSLPEDADVYQRAYDILKKNNGGKLRNSLDKFIESFEKDGKEYVDFVRNNTKLVISYQEYKNIEKICNTLKTNVYTSKYFINNDENIQILYQYPVYFTKEGMQFKVLPDIVYVNHYDKSVQMLDLKTTSKNIYKFEESFFMYNYYVQNSMDIDAYQALKQQLNIEEYKELPVLFMVCETDLYNAPFMYNFMDLQELGRNGGYYRGKRYKGYLELARELKWHKENELWEYPMDIYLTQGERVVYGEGVKPSDSK